MLEPITAVVVLRYGETELIHFSNGHRIYFDPQSRQHGMCEQHERNCLATLTFAERWALQHSKHKDDPD